LKRAIGVGVIGAGYWGRKLTGEYLAAEHRGKLKLIKVCDSSVAALGGLLITKETSSIGQSRLTQEIRDILDDSQISAVHIATPNHTHYALAKMALEAGKNVLVEKPMTLDSREAHELVELAASRELVLHVGHIFRFNSALLAARRILQSGEIGKLFYARVQWTDYSSLFPNRDIIFDLGPHPIDVLNMLLDEWPSKASGFARAYRNSKDHEEVAYVIAEFEDGVFAHIEVSWLHPSKVREVSVVGSDGTLVVDCLNQRVLRFKNGDTNELRVPASNTIESEIVHFIDCVHRRDYSSESGLIGARTVEVLETVRKSMWDRPIPMVEPLDRTAAMISVLEMVSNSTKQVTLRDNEKTAGAEFAMYAEMLTRSGFLRKVSGEKGTSYEITEAGFRFLKEYQNTEREIGRKRPQIWGTK
jgi:predicted dehydrogenase/predicted transcriptional regulator